ncbi:MAG: alanyl-tRNA editing protein, partial [Anaerolineae bacterium]
ARLLERKAIEGEDGVTKPAVRLNRTAFYPTSGGQPYDTGTLGGQQVVEVVEDAQGEIWHLLSGPLKTETDTIEGEIDWRRRFDHMQQHTGQHLLSAACEDIWGAKTTGFHLGSGESTIDLDIPQMSWEAAFRVENAVNRVVWEDRRVDVLIVDEDELSDIPLRKPPAVTGKIRVIWVEDYDASACGGTHVRRTGEIGLIKIVSLTRYKGGVRVGFLCGGRALRHYQRSLHILRTVSIGLSVGPDELPDAIDRLETEVKTTRKELGQVRDELLTYEADRLWEATAATQGVRMVVTHLPDRTFDEVRAIAGQLRERSKTLTLLGVAGENGLRVVCARSDDLAGIDAADLLRDVLKALGGRGGGSAVMAQGGAPPLSAERISEVFEDARAWASERICR